MVYLQWLLVLTSVPRITTAPMANNEPLAGNDRRSYHYSVASYGKPSSIALESLQQILPFAQCVDKIVSMMSMGQMLCSACDWLQLPEIVRHALNFVR